MKKLIIVLMLLTACGNPFIENYRSEDISGHVGVRLVMGRNVKDDREMMKNLSYQLVGSSIVKKHSMGLKGKAVRLAQLVGASHVYFYEETIKGKPSKNGHSSTTHTYQAWFYRREQ